MREGEEDEEKLHTQNQLLIEVNELRIRGKSFRRNKKWNQQTHAKFNRKKFVHKFIMDVLLCEIQLHRKICEG